MSSYMEQDISAWASDEVVLWLEAVSSLAPNDKHHYMRWCRACMCVLIPGGGGGGSSLIHLVKGSSYLLCIVKD